MNRRIFSVFLIIFAFVCTMFYFDNTEISTAKIHTNNTKDIQLTATNANVDEGFGDYTISSKSDIFTRKKSITINAKKDTNLDIELITPVYDSMSDKVSKTDIHKHYSPCIVYKDFDVNVNGNDTKIFDKIEVHDFPFSHNLKLKNGDTAEITYSQRYFSYSFNYIFVLFLFFLSAIFLKEKNVIELLGEKINKIPSLYKKTMLISVLSMFGAFFFHVTNMLVGNHDWHFLVSGLPIDCTIYKARYGAEIIKNLLFQGNYVPLLTDLVSFFALSLSGIMVLNYWKVPKKQSFYIIGTLLFVLQPFTLEWLYFTLTMPDMFFTPAIIVGALMLSDKCKDLFLQKKFGKFALYTILAILLMNLSISLYPSLINTIAILFLGKVFIELLFCDGEKNQVKSVFSDRIPAAINIVLAMLSFKAIVMWIDFCGKLLHIYAIEQISLSDLPQRILDCIYISFLQLGSYSFPFMPNSICVTFSALLILLVAVLILGEKEKVYNGKIVALQLIMLLLALFSTKLATTVCAEPQFLETRIDFCGLHFFRILIVCALFIKLVNRQNLLNFTILCSAAIISISTINDLKGQKVWNLALNVEKTQMNRIYERIEADKNFDRNRMYSVIEIGKLKPTREIFYSEKHIKQYDSLALLTHHFDPYWEPFRMMEVVVGKYFIDSRYNPEEAMQDKDFQQLFKKAYEKGLLKNAKSWPDKNSIIIDDGLIIFIADDSAIEGVVKEIYKQD